MKNIIEIIESTKIDDILINKMFEIMSDWYEGDYEKGLTEYLPEKYNAILVWNKSKSELLGFHLYSMDSTIIDTQEILVFNSGDFASKINNKIASGTLIQATLSELHSNWKKANGKKLFWFLPIGSYFVYHYSSVLFNNFYPCPDNEIPKLEKKSLDYIAAKTFGNAYNSATFIIHHQEDNYYFKDKEDFNEDIEEDILKSYYHKINPNSNDGDELATIAEIHENNFSKYGHLLAMGRRGLKL